MTVVGFDGKGLERCTMRRWAPLLSMLLTLLFPSLAAAGGTWLIWVHGNVLTDPIRGGLPVPDIQVQIWEGDSGFDDIVALVNTDGNGHFDWSGSVTDRDGLTDPDIYIRVGFTGSRLWLSDDHANPSTNYVTGKLTPTYHVEDCCRIGDHLAEIAVGNLWLDDGLYMSYAGDWYENFQQMLDELGWPSSGPFHPRAGVCMELWGTPHSYCDNQVYFFTPDDFSKSGFSRCILGMMNALSGTPPPPGGGFNTVTNDGYAWDEGIVAFLAEALTLDHNPQAPGTSYLESGIAAPPTTADAPKVGATVAACLYDLYDSHNDNGPGLGSDQYNGSLPQIMNILYRRPVHSLADFWNFWKADGLSLHLPLLALWNNGVDYDTPPVFTDYGFWYVKPNTQAAYPLWLDWSDAESPDNLMTFTGHVMVQSDPVQWYISGSTLYATMNPQPPPGHATWEITASDGIRSVTGTARISWNEGASKPGHEIDDPTNATDPRAEGGPGAMELVLSGTSLIRTVGRFEFTLPIACDARLSVYDVSGRLVATLAEGLQSAGRHEVTWSGEGGGGKPGVYLLELRARDQRRTMRTVLVR